jgi:hypothetical protein
MTVLLIGFVALAALVSGVAYVDYLRARERRRGNTASSFEVERALVAFERASERHGREDLTVQARWWLESGDARASSAPVLLSYRVQLWVRSPRIPRFLELRESLSRELRPWATDLVQRLPAPGLAEVERGLGAGLRVSEGAVEVSERVSASDRAQDVAARLSDQRALALRVAAALVELDALAPSWLSAQAREGERKPRRLQALELLCRHYPDDAETRAACELALQRGRQPERLRAALFLGPIALRALAPDLDPSQVPAELWGEALDALAGALEPAQLVAQLERSLEVADPTVLRRTIAAYDAVDVAPPLDRLVLLAGKSRDVEVLLLVVMVLGQSGSAQAEPALLHLLTRSAGAPRARREELRQALVLALAQTATASAVQPLREVAQADSTSAALRAACDSAVAAIQARIEGGELGGLALIEDRQGGELALSEHEGELSFADDLPNEE